MKSGTLKHSEASLLVSLEPSVPPLFCRTEMTGRKSRETNSSEKRKEKKKSCWRHQMRGSTPDLQGHREGYDGVC